MPMCPNCNTFFVQEVKGLAKNHSLHCPFLRWGVLREKGCLEICGDTHFYLDFSTDRGIYVKYRYYAGFVVCRCFILCASGGCGYSLPSEVFLFLDHTIFRAYLFISGSGLGPVATFSLITPIWNIGWDTDPGSTAFLRFFPFSLLPYSFPFMPSAVKLRHTFLLFMTLFRLFRSLGAKAWPTCPVPL